MKKLPRLLSSLPPCTYLHFKLKYVGIASPFSDNDGGIIVDDGVNLSSSTSAGIRVVYEFSEISGCWPIHSDTSL
jgi:hypothetical protein